MDLKSTLRRTSALHGAPDPVRLTPSRPQRLCRRRKTTPTPSPLEAGKLASLHHYAYAREPQHVRAAQEARCTTVGDPHATCSRTRGWGHVVCRRLLFAARRGAAARTRLFAISCKRCSRRARVACMGVCIDDIMPCARVSDPLRRRALVVVALGGANKARESEVVCKNVHACVHLYRSVAAHAASELLWPQRHAWAETVHTPRSTDAVWQRVMHIDIDGMITTSSHSVCAIHTQSPVCRLAKIWQAIRNPCSTGEKGAGDVTLVKNNPASQTIAELHKAQKQISIEQWPRFHMRYEVRVFRGHRLLRQNSSTPNNAAASNSKTVSVFQARR